MSMVRHGAGGFTGNADIDYRRQVNNQNAAVENAASMVHEQQRANALALQGNLLLAAQTQLAANANAILTNMCEAMAILDKVALESLKSSLRQEIIQQEQLDLHKKHYGTIERERDLKELVFQMEKFSHTLDQFTDPVAKGYWASQQIRRVNDHGFSTKDIADLNDKRLFDQLMAKAEQAVSALSEGDRNEVEQYTMAQAYLLEIAMPAESGVPPIEESESEEPVPPQLPAFGGRTWDEGSVHTLAQLCADVEGLQYRGVFFEVLFLFGLGWVTLFIGAKTGTDFGMMAGGLLFMGLMIFSIVRLFMGLFRLKSVIDSLGSMVGVRLGDHPGTIKKAVPPIAEFARAWKTQFEQAKREHSAWTSNAKRQREQLAWQRARREKDIVRLQKERDKERIKTAEFMASVAKTHPDLLQPTAAASSPRR